MIPWPYGLGQDFKDKETIFYCPINYNDNMITVTIIVTVFIMISNSQMK